VSTRATPCDAGGKITLRASILVHPATGRLLSPILLDAVRSRAMKDLDIESIPVPIRCAHHGRWHALPGITGPTLTLPILPDEDGPLPTLGTVLALASAPSCRDAAKRAAAFQAAWRRMSKQLPTFDKAPHEAGSDMDGLLNACLDSLTLVPRALSRAGVDLQQALTALASAPLPHASHPVWPHSPSISFERGHTILPHRCPVSQDWHAAGSVRVPLTYLVDYPTFFENVHGVCAVLAAQMSATCEEAVQRLRLASRHLDRHTSKRLSRAYILACQRAARALRAATLPPADLALEALKNA
jgi:hypothetical protein